jgi:DNA repair protein radC
MQKNKTIKELPASERPYEKFLSLGASGLSDADLLAIIIKTGTKDKSAVDIAQEMLSGRHGNLLNLYEMSYDELIQVSGIGQIKAIQLKAVAELSMRISKAKRARSIRMNTPVTIADYYMEQMRHLQQEVVICAYFDVKSRFLGDKFISKGSLSSSVVDISSVMRTALEKNASKIVLLHNHPSGDCTPSKDDIAVTDRLAEGSRIFSIELCDHIIIGDNEYYSFYENKLI